MYAGLAVQHTTTAQVQALLTNAGHALVWSKYESSAASCLGWQDRLHILVVVVGFRVFLLNRESMQNFRTPRQLFLGELAIGLIFHQIGIPIN